MIRKRIIIEERINKNEPVKLQQVDKYSKAKILYLETGKLPDDKKDALQVLLNIEKMSFR